MILVFANKSDARGSLSGADLASELNLQSIKKHSWHIQSCCALTGQGLYEVSTCQLIRQRGKKLEADRGK